MLEVSPHRDGYLRLLTQVVILPLHHSQQLLVQRVRFLQLPDCIRLFEVDLLETGDLPFEAVGRVFEGFFMDFETHILTFVKFKFVSVTIIFHF
jgi:hypothetical protein